MEIQTNPKIKSIVGLWQCWDEF